MKKIVVDTSAWINHLRYFDTKVASALEHGILLVHPFIIGELALGSLKNQDEFLSNLMLLPKVSVASDAEVLELINLHKLYAKGIGWVDAHLITSSIIDSCELYTYDKKLQNQFNKI